MLRIEWGAGGLLAGVEIPATRGVHHHIGKRRRWGVPVPATRAPLRVEPIAQWLFVETRLRAARLVLFGAPDTRTVWREDFVDQQRTAADVTELELGVGDDDAALRGQVTATAVHAPAETLQVSGSLRAEQGTHSGDGDVLVVPDGGLRGRTEDRLCESIALDETGREILTCERPLLAVLLPSRSGQVAAHDTFHGEHLGAAAKHRPAAERLAVRGEGWNQMDDLIRIRAQHVVGDLVLELAQPERGNLRQHGALERHA